MFTELAELRTRIRSLQMQRIAHRVASAGFGVMTMICWIIVFWYVCDRLFNLSAVSRFGLHLIAAMIFFLWFRHSFWPLFITRESDEEIALIIERAHRLDSSLIAALQFESPQVLTWGSTRLTSAVIHDAATLAESLKPDDGLNLHRLSQRALPLVCTLTLMIASNITWPAHAQAFWDRVCLGSEQYPTRTQIVSLTLNGQSISVNHADFSPEIRVPFGQSIAIEIEGRGEIPAIGFAHVSNRQHEDLTHVKLNPISKQAKHFRGELTQLVEPIEVTIHLGDALPRRVAIEIVPLPFVDVDWNVELPTYARAATVDDASDRGARQRSVLEGSAVHLKLMCSNKRLQSARLATNGITVELTPATGDDRSSVIWKLPAGTVFECLRESMKYEIQVIDQDGLSLERPIVGQLRVMADHSPRITVSTVTRRVLPTAQPKIDYVATDDFGLAAIHAVVEISNEDGNSSRHELPDSAPMTSNVPLADRSGQFTVSLAPYSIRKGDTVQVTLIAEDWRGDQAGQRTASAPITFSVVELSDILLDAGEEDKKAAKQLEEILKREQAIKFERK